MPKLKTNKAIRKRFKITKRGKVMAIRTKRRHLLGDRSPSKKRQLRKWQSLDKMDAKAIIRALPYG